MPADPPPDDQPDPPAAHHAHLPALEPAMATAGGTVSVWCGPVGGPPAYARLEDVPHYPASTMKLAVLAAAYQLADAGALDLDREVPVHDDFASAAAGAARFRMDPEYDSDPAVWAKLGGTATLRWLARRMIVVSSNLATNLVLEHTGYPAATQTWRAAAAHAASVRHTDAPPQADAPPQVDARAGGPAPLSVVNRGIEDYAARDAGLDNLVTAAELAALLSAIQADQIASPGACEQVRQILLAQQKNDDLPTGLPPGTPIAHKNGWVDGIRHDAAIVYPHDTRPYVLVVCLTTERSDQEMRDLMRRIAAASWADRHTLGSRLRRSRRYEPTG
jgi:beta-lactamase class A